MSIVGLFGVGQYLLELIEVAVITDKGRGKIHEKGFRIVSVVLWEHGFQVSEEELSEVSALNLILQVIEIRHRPLEF